MAGYLIRFMKNIKAVRYYCRQSKYSMNLKEIRKKRTSNVLVRILNETRERRFIKPAESDYRANGNY